MQQRVAVVRLYTAAPTTTLFRCHSPPAGAIGRPRLSIDPYFAGISMALPVSAVAGKPLR